MGVAVIYSTQRFSDGCRECKCESGAVLCKKGGCKFFSHPGQDVLDYCETVYQKNAQKLASKKKELSELETRNNATTKVDLNSDKVDELTDQEKAEATAKLQKLVETYISNQPDESASGGVEKLPYQVNQEGTIIEEEKEPKRELVASKPSLLQGSPLNESVKPELGEVISKSGLTYSDNSNGDLYIHPSVSLSNHDAAPINQQKEDHLREKTPRKRSRRFGSDKHFSHASEFRPKRKPDYNTIGAVGDITVNGLSSWPLHSEHESGHESSAIYGSPEITARERDRSRNRNLMKNKWKEGNRRNRMLANAAYRGRSSSPKRFEGKQTRIMGSSQNWPSQEEDFWGGHSTGFGERYHFIPIQHYKDVKHRNHQRQSLASLQHPRHASRQKARLEKDETIGVGSVPDSHGGAMKSADTVKRNMRLIHSDYVQMQNNDLDEKKHQELLNEVKTFTVLSNMAVNLLVSENFSQNNSKALNVRNAGEFKRIVAMIEESIRIMEAGVESFSIQTAAERQKLLRDIPERLNYLVDWTKTARVMLSGADDLGDDIKNEQLNEILIVMEDIASTLSAAIEKEFETWSMDSTDETHHLKREGHLYTDANDDANSAEANEAAALEWKLTHCMMLCSRFLEMA
ncbi:unnamed protein product [Taenia asiatica]|uniref:CAP-Gly domain-containing protein n=1 Tax=Taenia asiatica TaxID=60517 RepID=A0A0R3WFN7_TAEAS|nr:unnamed protein product [Taenia asiatica]